MRILIISDFESKGGAAIACSRLAQGLIDRRHEVIRLVHRADNVRRPWQTIEFDYAAYVPRLCLAVRNRLPSSMRSRFESALVVPAMKQLVRSLAPDVINLHNLHGAIHRGSWPLEVLDAFRSSCPVVWTLHDIWSFTGRCAHRTECNKHLTGCDAACPTPTQYPALTPERIRHAWVKKAEYIAGARQLTAVCPSRWMADEARAGMWKNRRIEVIPNGLDLQTFRPMARADARRRLGIPASARAILAVADDLSDPYKGMGILVSALARLKTSVTLITVGAGRLPQPSVEVRVRALGRVDDSAMMSALYSSADLFVHPSQADNLPNVLIESIACGTPAVGFRIGGISEVIRPNLTGWLAQATTAESLADTISTALQEVEAGRELGPICRRIAEDEYGHDRQAEAYETLFKQLAQ